MIHFRRLALLSALTVPFSLVAVPAAAQSASDLEEVIVTARKQEENLQDAPVTVSAFTSEDIERYGARSLDDLARLAPGLSFSKAFGRSTERPVVRGLSNVLAGVRFGVESGAAFFVDGIYYPGALQGINIDDIERLEVVKGAQSALFGRNSYSGAINFITKGVAEEASGRVKLGFGTDGRQALSASWSQPFDDSLGLRLSARTDSYDGEWDNLVTGQTIGDEETTNLSATLDWDVGDGIDMRFRLDVQSLEDGTRPFFLQPASENNCHPRYQTSGGDAGTPVLNAAGNPVFGYFCGAIEPRPIALNDGAHLGTTATLTALQAELGYFFGPAGNTLKGVPFSGVERDVTLFSWQGRFDLFETAELTLNLGYRTEEETTGSDSDHSPVQVYFGPTPQTNQSLDGTGGSSIANTGFVETTDYSFEAILASSADQDLRWRAGLYVYNQSQESRALVFSGNGASYMPEAATRIDEADLENMALFGGISYDFSEQLTLDVEFRYQDETKDLVDNSTSARSPDQVTQEGDWDSLTPRVTLSWQMDEDTLLYGVFAQGAKPGGLNARDGATTGLPTYEQEESSGLEFGVKRVWADGRFLSNLAVYFNQISEQQGTEPIQSPSGAINSVASNKGEGEVFGVELDLAWQPSESLRLGLTYALASSEYTEGCDDWQWRITSGGGLFLPSYPNGLSAADLVNDAVIRFNATTTATGTAAMNLNNPNGQGNCSIVGNQFAFAPETQLSATADYETPMAFLGEDGQFFASLNMGYESKRYAQVHNGAYTDAATIVGGRIGVRAAKWEAALTGGNLTDDDTPVVVTRWVSPFFGTYPRWFFANPRAGSWFTMDFSYRF